MCHDLGQAGAETMYSKRRKDNVDRIVGNNVTQGSLMEEQEKCHKDNEKCILRPAQN
jgi:hypothetical protein